MSYQPGAPGDWGRMQGSPDITIGTEELTTTDACKHFLRSWQTGGTDILLILHGLSGHSGWYIDMSNALASHGITVYAMDHRGFGRSGGLPGHIDDYHIYLHDIKFILAEIRKRHPADKIYLLGHSMGGLFAAYVAAQYSDLLAGVLFLNPWIQDTSRLSLFTIVGILAGGLFKSKRYWRVIGGIPTMTTNPEAIRMLQADTFWQQEQTASCLFQLLLMRLSAFQQAKRISIPALVMQAEGDKAVLAKTNQQFYAALASAVKSWTGYPNYTHDSEFERDRSQLDHDILTWITEQSAASNRAPSQKTDVS